MIREYWIPAYAGMTRKRKCKDEERAGNTGFKHILQIIWNMHTYGMTLRLTLRAGRKYCISTNAGMTRKRIEKEKKS